MARTGAALAGMAVLLLIPASGSAQNASYLPNVRLDGPAFLGPPPAADGPRQKADLAAVRAWQGDKAGARWRQAQSDDDISPFTAFGQVLGPQFTPERLPKTKALFVVLFDDVKSVTAPAKAAFGRPRPPLVDRRIETCRPLEQTASYPSGHAARGWMMALLLSDMAPERTNALLARGRDYGDSRVVCGEHFPSDVEAGRLVGAAVAGAARQDPRFRQDLAEARAELRSALGLPALP